MDKTISRLRLACVAIAAAAIALILAEYALMPLVVKQHRLPNRETALLGIVATPNTMVDDTRINEQGFTGDVLAEKRPGGAGSVRILTLGGSSFFNHGMTDRLIRSLSGVTARRLEIQGGALRTHTSRSDVLKYKYYFHKYSFDYVLLYEGINDLWANNVAAADFQDDYSHLSAWNKKNILLDHSLIARYFYNSVLWAEPQTMRNGSRYRSLTVVEGNIRELIKMIRKDGGTPILMTFAWHIPPDYDLERFWADELDYFNPSHYDKWPVELWGDPDDVREGLTRHNALVRKVAREENVPLIDLESSFRLKPWYFGDVCHFNEAGTAAAIAQITDFFVAGILRLDGRE